MPRTMKIQDRGQDTWCPVLACVEEAMGDTWTLRHCPSPGHGLGLSSWSVTRGGQRADQIESKRG